MSLPDDCFPEPKPVYICVSRVLPSDSAERAPTSNYNSTDGKIPQLLARQVGIARSDLLRQTQMENIFINAGDITPTSALLLICPSSLPPSTSSSPLH
jgi:hypothetical protein